MLNGLRRRVTYANVVATLALVMATGGTAMAAVMITSNSQVAQNTISGHAAPAGKHANLIPGSINATDLNKSVNSSIKVHCPSGMQRSSADLCFDATPQNDSTWDSALAACQAANKRLPDAAELAEVFNNEGASTNQQWTNQVFFDGSKYAVITLRQDDSRVLHYIEEPTNFTFAFQCVVTPTN